MNYTDYEIKHLNKKSYEEGFEAGKAYADKNLTTIDKLFSENTRLLTIIDFLQITIRDQRIVIFQQKEKL